MRSLFVFARDLRSIVLCAEQKETCAHTHTGVPQTALGQNTCPRRVDATRSK